MKKQPWILACMLVLACNKAKPTPEQGAGTMKLYGQALATAQALPIGRIISEGAALKGQTVTAVGQVRKACSRKGCWMELADGTEAALPGCRVTFKNYGFFVPTDAAGSMARVQGLVEVDRLSAAAVRHYEEEGAAFPGKDADGTALEVRLVATGVELSKRL